MITNERNKELSHSGFYPLTADRYRFEYRGVEVTISLFGAIWFCVTTVYDYSCVIPVDTPAIEMVAQLRQWILATVPADRLREEGYNSLDWISSSVRSALAQERAEAIPFNGELNPADADDGVPAQYGL